MSQGKAFTPEQREMIIESIKPFLEMGFSRNKACEMVGLDPTTLSKWVQADEALSMKLTGWENTISALALHNMRDVIAKEGELEDTKKENTRWWLERKLKEFNPKQDITTDGEKLDFGVVILPSKDAE